VAGKQPVLWTLALLRALNPTYAWLKNKSDAGNVPRWTSFLTHRRAKSDLSRHYEECLLSSVVTTADVSFVSQYKERLRQRSALRRHYEEISSLKGDYS
jgi:hypothetical protein